MYIIAPLSALNTCPFFNKTVKTCDSEPETREDTSKSIGVATTPSLERIWIFDDDDASVVATFATAVVLVEEKHLRLLTGSPVLTEDARRRRKKSRFRLCMVLLLILLPQLILSPINCFYWSVLESI